MVRESLDKNLNPYLSHSGGFITNEISDATHLVFCNGMDANTFLTAYPSYKRKHRQHIVNVRVSELI